MHGEVLPNKVEKEELYKKAVDTWGEESQVMQTIQEFAELIKELSDLKRKGRTNSQKIATEVADCEIMLGQMKYLFSSKFKDFEEAYNLEIERKHKKLKEYLEISN